MKNTTTTQVITIKDVIRELDKIIEWSKENQSRVGYFAVLYRMVTQRVELGIEQNEFNDNPRMEKLDVIFAKRYIDAFWGWQRKEEITHSWQVAFEATENSSTIVLQQILLGINAHINLDLGLSTMLTMENKDPFDDIVTDFDAINNVLAGLVDKFKARLIETSPLVKLACKIGKGKENLLATFSIDIARAGAWYFASNLRNASMSPTSDKKVQDLIERKDQKVGDNAKELASPTPTFLKLFVWIASLTESNKPSEVIVKLESHADDILKEDTLAMKVATSSAEQEQVIITEEVLEEI